MRIPIEFDHFQSRQSFTREDIDPGNLWCPLDYGKLIEDLCDATLKELRIFNNFITCRSEPLVDGHLVQLEVTLAGYLKRETHEHYWPSDIPEITADHLV